MISDNAVLRYIRDGIKTTATFNYDGEALTVRPLRSAEIDDAKIHGYEYVSPNLARLLVNIYIGKVSPSEIKESFPVDMYKNFDKYYREIDYWIVYHGMKDFMPEDFTIDDVRSMRYVHDIAKLIIGTSTSDSETLRRIIRTKDGAELANITYIFKVPLAKTVRDLTPLQEMFLWQTMPSKTPEKLKVSSIEELEEIMPYLKGMV